MHHKTSIIIVSYNNYAQTTGPCLGSLLRDEKNRDVEIIVVDNGSADRTPEELKRIASGNANVKPVLNSTNRGFAGGNNDGVAVSGGDIVILLNSDTLVPKDSVAKLSKLLYDNHKWGMLGPATNEAGTEQKILAAGTEPDDIINQGMNWCAHSNDDSFDSPRLDFFCVAIRKEIYESLGGLDESFGMGYYEDTDFSMKAAKAGCRMMFTESVFIWHKGGESFATHGNRAVRDLMKRNRRKLKAKYPGDCRLWHMRDRNLEVMKQYVRLKNAGQNHPGRLENLRYRFDGRMKLAESMYPNNPFKKLRYRRALKKATCGFEQS